MSGKYIYKSIALSSPFYFKKISLSYHPQSRYTNISSVKKTALFLSNNHNLNIEFLRSQICISKNIKSIVVQKSLSKMIDNYSVFRNLYIILKQQ